MKKLTAGQDCFGRTVQMLCQADTIYAIVLAAGVSEIHNVPAGAQYVLFSANCDFIMRFDGGVLVWPGADIEDNTAGELNPSMRVIQGHAAMSLISSVGGILTCAYYG